MQDEPLSNIERKLYVEKTAQRLIDTCTIAAGTLRLRFLGRPGGDFSFVLDFTKAQLDNARGATESLHEVAGGTVFPPKYLPKAPLPWTPVKLSDEHIPGTNRHRFRLDCGAFQMSWESEFPIF